jgi:Peptidase inhibitor family I36
MPRLLQSRLKKMALIVAVPSAAIMVVFGALPAALAVNWTTQAHCSDTHVCYYKNADFAPNGSANQVLNINGLVRDWTNINDPAFQCHPLGGAKDQNWNDCASSYWSRYNTTIEYAWTDVFCTGSRLVIYPTDKKSMNTIFNDKVSSDRDNNGNSNC